MNGALIHDYFASGKLGSPIHFAQQYYERLPATSIPYHPLLFPAFEAGCYALFGVNLVAARIAIAITVFACGVLLFKLIKAIYGSAVLAAAGTVAWVVTLGEGAPAPSASSNCCDLSIRTKSYSG